MKCKNFKKIEKEREGCPATSAYACTRKKGHKGKHHGHTLEECLEIWSKK